MEYEIEMAEEYFMKIEWQAIDVAYGRLIVLPDKHTPRMIVWSAVTDKYHVVDLAEGILGEPKSDADMAEFLTKLGAVPFEFVSSPKTAGGLARAAALTPERRAQIAVAAANKRWGGK